MEWYGDGDGEGDGEGTWGHWGIHRHFVTGRGFVDEGEGFVWGKRKARELLGSSWGGADG